MTMMSVVWEAQVREAPIALSGNDNLLMLGTAEGEAHAFTAEAGTITHSVNCEGGLLGIALAPNHPSAVLHGPFGSWLWSPQSSGAPIALVPDVWCAKARWVNEDRFVVAAGRHVVTFDRSGTELWRSERLPSTATDVVWLGGRHRVAAASYGGVHVMEPRPRGPVTHMSFKGSLLALAATPQGKWIVSGNQDASLQVFKPDDETRLEMQGYPNKIAVVTFDSSGAWLANSGSSEITVWDFRGAGPRGRAPVLCVSQVDSDEPTCFVWRPREPVLLIGWASGQVTLHRIENGIPGRPLVGEPVHEVKDDPVDCLMHSQEQIVVAHHSGRIIALTDGVRS